MSDLTEEEKRIWRADFENMIASLRREIDDSTSLTKEEKEGWHRFLTQCLVSSNGAPDKLQSMSETNSATAVALVKHVIRGPENLRAVLRTEIPRLLDEAKKKEQADEKELLERDREQLDAHASKIVWFFTEIADLTPKQWLVLGALGVYVILKLFSAPDGAVNAALAKLISLLT